MNELPFSEFITLLKAEINKGLPGWEAQKRMAVPGRPVGLQGATKEKQPRISAVLLWLYPLENKVFIRLIQRTSIGDVHSGQVAFPGGSVEQSDIDLWHTAIREANEEVGLVKDNVSFVGELTSLYIPPSNFIVHPFIGAGEAYTPAYISKNEVQEYFDIDISLLTDDSLKGEMLIKRPGVEKGFLVPCYNLSGHQVWGATAIMLSELEELIRRINAQ